jgi:hypothetical protein
LAQTAYKYKDANGQWVFTDRTTSSAGTDNSFALEHQNDTLRITIDRKDSGDSTQLRYRCFCTDPVCRLLLLLLRRF